MNASLKLYNARVLGRDGTLRSSQSLLLQEGVIQWVGDDHAYAEKFGQLETQTFDAQGQLLTAGLIDCHTHLIYGGNRSHEFRLRLEGQSYADIAKAGGGILNTVMATRQASEEALLEAALPRALALRGEGVTTLEIKSGYGLTLESEMKMLRVARALGQATGQRIRTTFLGAHAIPPEYQGRAQAYVDYICNEMLPRIAEAGLADAVDAFCEHIAFDVAQTEQILTATQRLGLPFKCHAEQLSNIGATEMAARLGAMSCEHLEYLNESGVAAMQQCGGVAVLLPGAFYYLAETQIPPIALFRKYGIPMAIATDSNPGSSPTASLLLMLSMACRYFKLTVDEALAAVTVNAAQALGLRQSLGIIAEGFSADLVLWSIAEPADLCYHFASPLPHRTMIGGQWIA